MSLEGQEGSKGDAMREFLILWRLREGPRSEEDLVGSLNACPGTEEAVSIATTIGTLVGKGRLQKKDGILSLTEEGQRMMDNAPDIFASGILDIFEKNMEVKDLGP